MTILEIRITHQGVQYACTILSESLYIMKDSSQRQLKHTLEIQPLIEVEKWKKQEKRSAKNSEVPNERPVLCLSLSTRE